MSDDCGVYVGSSAGTLLAGPDILIAETGDDSSVVTLSDTVGIGLIATAYSPHYTDAEASVIEKYQSEASYPIKTLRDGEAVLCVAGNETIL